MLVVSLTGSPNPTSRSGALLTVAGKRLARRGIEIASYGVRDFPAQDLLYARFDSAPLRRFVDHVARADGLLIATPVYKASFAGALKVLLDLLPERALADKVVLPIATAGSPAHMLVLDYALRPVLTALKATEILQGVFAADQQIVDHTAGAASLSLAPELESRLDEAIEQFQAALWRRAAVPRRAGNRLSARFSPSPGPSASGSGDPAEQGRGHPIRQYSRAKVDP